MTHRPTLVSKYRSQGLSQQLSNLQIRRAFKRNTLLMAETYSQLISTQDSCKYIYFNNWLQNVPAHYRLNSLVQLLQQLVTVHRRTTQPYTVALTTGYSVPAGYRLHSPVHLLPQLVSECTDRYRLHSPIHLHQ